MFNSKYSKILTIILIVLIVAIFGTIVYFVYDYVAINAKNNKTQQALEEFDDKSIRREFDFSGEDDKDENGDASNPLEDIKNIDTNSSTEEKSEKTYLEGYEVMGKISIPKTGIEYPVLSEVTKKSLETSVAILYGVGLNQPGNTTIAGHNYRNGLFFSDNKKLSKGDIIKITDQTGTTITYSIYDMYETDPSDAEYMLRDTQGAREISLSTCTDDSKARLIILAKEK